MMFPHNGKIITIDQVSHYEPNPYANIDNILSFIHTNPEVYPLIEMGPKTFKDPSLLETYHGVPSIIHPSNQLCVISSKRTNIEDTLLSSEASLISDIPLVVELLPPEYPENLSTPPVHDFTSP
jgi:hypothetical protein